MKQVMDNSEAGLESPTAKSIIDQITTKRPVDTVRFLDKFVQVKNPFMTIYVNM
jgi:hypothetical protein